MTVLGVNVVKFDGMMIKQGLQVEKWTQQLVGFADGPMDLAGAKSLIGLSDRQRVSFLCQDEATCIGSCGDNVYDR